MGKNTKKTLRYKRKRSVIRNTRRNFLLTFFKDSKEEYKELTLNGFLLVKYYDKEHDRFVVNIYNDVNAEEYRDWYTEFNKSKK